MPNNELTIVQQGAPAVTSPEDGAIPQQIGRFRVERVLGQGGFGLVYLAHDSQLKRPVAIKVPHPRLVAQPDQAEAYLVEARTVAGLDHPHIVPVYDVGGTNEFPCFVVAKYIDGTDLTTRLKNGRLPIHEAVALVATVAEALHYAHKQGLVHRDIKPGNILLDAGNNPFVADFGLALREQDMGKGPRYAGTPAYMSPEQARGEGHRVDGRSDIFSLGVVFYELLTGRRPFVAESQAELMELIASHETRPPRQYDDTIPKELERICLKALAKRASERYTTAKDMADDLRHFLAEQPVPATPGISSSRVAPLASLAPATPTPSATPTPPDSDGRQIRIVPKGLRSFDAHDAGFFLELLPGPRDRDEIPDSLRFWKTRIEETDPDQTFPVGLIYGPSGCGKSSLVKAGLLPRLSESVVAVYVEATAEETETRLLNGLRKRCPALPAFSTLKDTLAALRQGVFGGKKVVIVLDQFEQWLHARKEEQNAELVQALRQCDGGRVQCIVMVRDDFWMAATRFMRELEVRLLEGQNSAAVDLFPIRHAEKVLAAFGRAFGVLHDAPGGYGKEQQAFLKQAVAGLAQEAKVIPVRLALFAELMKNRPWTPASLREVGGAEGVGVTFLEETFSATTAPPEHRYHQEAARAVLNALLPEPGADIKGHMRSHGELLEASGYSTRRNDFDDLLRILDSELRLITPTDREGRGEGGGSARHPEPRQKYYQLTHDYLVPSLRDWLTRKQRETRRGRAELLLADRAAVWNARSENRQLPSLVQWLQIRWHTAKKDWTSPQRKMMRKARRHHTVWITALGVLLAMIAVGAFEVRSRVVEQRNATRAAGLVQRCRDAETAQVPGIVSEMSEYRRWTDPLLRAEYENAAADSRQKLHASLALLPVDESQADYLAGRLLDATPEEVPVIRAALAPHKDALRDKLWAAVRAPAKGRESQRLRAAAALASYDPDGPLWSEAGALVVNDLVQVNPVFLGKWSVVFSPVRKRLIPRLMEIFQDREPDRTAERLSATNLLCDYVADQPNVLADLLMDADARQFALIYPKFEGQGERGLPVLSGEIDKKLPRDVPSSDDQRERLARRQANAAAVLLKMNQPFKAWPLLQHGPDPRVQSYLIHRLSSLGADPRAIIKRLEEEPDVTIRGALILSLGEFGPEKLTPPEREELIPKIERIYISDPDAGIHGAADWLLRVWHKQERVTKIDRDAAKNGDRRPARAEHRPNRPGWYVNGQGQTMVVLPRPGDVVMSEDPGTSRKVQIGYSYALAAKEVTVEQYLRFTRDADYDKNYSRTLDSPANGVTWYEAAAYCNWLTKQEGLPDTELCYVPNDDGRFGPGMKVAPDVTRRTGYRLPTEAEWEYACRAGAVTSRYYGEAESLLDHYAWSALNSRDTRMLPVGSLKPNDFGFFDMLGNAAEWCQDAYVANKPRPDGKGGGDVGDPLSIPDNRVRVIRGGSCNYLPKNVHSGRRNWYLPANRNYHIGLRPLRVMPAE